MRTRRVSEFELSLSIVIPTYGRDRVLVDTINQLLALGPPAHEIIVVDQTPKHEHETAEQLASWNAGGAIRLIHQEAPSVTRAMNAGLMAARGSIVLFLDDDIRPEPKLLAAHLDEHQREESAIVAGRVLQPWHEGMTSFSDEPFQFADLTPRDVDGFMGGNVSIRRKVALALGGFDENFVRVAYNFEQEFAYRARQAGHRIFYAPEACIHHLKEVIGGTRSYGEHLKTVRPDHAVGAYYNIFRTWSGPRSLAMLLHRPMRAILTRHHLRHPWWVPLTLVAEARGLIWATRLAVSGPRYARLPSHWDELRQC